MRLSVDRIEVASNLGGCNDDLMYLEQSES